MFNQGIKTEVQISKDDYVDVYHVYSSGLTCFGNLTAHIKDNMITLNYKKILACLMTQNQFYQNYQMIKH